MRFRIVLLIILFTPLASAVGQQVDSIRLVANNSKERLQLKWLPANFDLWMRGLKNGYRIERYEMQKEAGKWKTIKKDILTDAPVKPWDLDRLKREAPNDPDLKNIDLMLAGKDLNEKVNPKGMKEYAELQSQKDLTFMLALYAQILKNKTAEAMGTYFEDKTALPGKTYLYRVILNEPKGIKGEVIVERSKLTTLPAIPGFAFENVHKGVDLYWLNQKQSGYIYYDIYRSESKSSNYKKLNEYPFIGEITKNEDKKRLRYSDSIPEMGKTYYYKVIGYNAFEQFSPYTEPITVVAKYFLQKAPFITEGESPDNKNVKLDWKVYEEEKPYIKGFSVWHSNSGTGEYSKLNDKLIGAGTYTYTDTRKSKGSSNYYTVCAYGQYGDSACSVLKGVFLIDSIPPAPPIVVSGVCDSNGVVTLKWKKGKEPDVLGYRVFRTYYSHKEPERITVEYVSDTLIIDTVEVKSGFRKVFYGVSAIDEHYNASPLSVYFTVKIPDHNPPVNATFKDYQAGYSGISLKWIASPSDDIKTLHLLKKSEFDFAWQPFQKYSGDSLKITQTRDTITKSGIWYEYKLIAEDSSGLKTDNNETLRIMQPEKNPFPVVKNVQAFVSKENKMVKLTWDFDMNAVGFKIMKSKKGQPVETYEFISGAQREFYDKWLTPNTEYTYAIIAEIAGGRKSLMSSTVNVKY